MRDRLTLQPLWQDIRYSGRTLRSSPVFSLTVLLTVALSIGPVTAILSVGNWLLWRPHPGVTDARSLAVVWFGQWRQNGRECELQPVGSVVRQPCGDSIARAHHHRHRGRSRKQFESLRGWWVAPGSRHRRGHVRFLRCPRRAARRRQKLHSGRRSRPVRLAGRRDQPRACVFSIRITARRPRQIRHAQQPAVHGHRRGSAVVRRHFEHRGHRRVADRRDVGISEPCQGVARRPLLRVRRQGGTGENRRRGRERIDRAGEAARRC